MKTAVVYWSGTGNTEAMARAVAEGMTAAGAEAVLLTPDQVQPGDLNTYGAIAFGCPAMGSEVLEEMEFQPMFARRRTSCPPGQRWPWPRCCPCRSNRRWRSCSCFVLSVVRHIAAISTFYRAAWASCARLQPC